MPNFGRSVLPMIMPPILIFDRSRKQRLGCQVIQAG